jgi:hypothetical protein
VWETSRYPGSRDNSQEQHTEGVEQGERRIERVFSHVRTRHHLGGLMSVEEVASFQRALEELHMDDLSSQEAGDPP